MRYTRAFMWFFLFWSQVWFVQGILEPGTIAKWVFLGHIPVVLGLAIASERKEVNTP